MWVIDYERIRIEPGDKNSIRDEIFIQHQIFVIGFVW